MPSKSSSPDFNAGSKARFFGSVQGVSAAQQQESKLSWRQWTAPHVALINPPEAKRCDCGYDFVLGVLVFPAFYFGVLPTACNALAMWRGEAPV